MAAGLREGANERQNRADGRDPLRPTPGSDGGEVWETGSPLPVGPGSAGRRLTPGALMTLQRLAGNRAARQLVPGGAAGATPSRREKDAPVVQRYFAHTPQANEATAGHFEAQQKVQGTSSFLDATGAPNISVSVGPMAGIGPAQGPVIPQLRVSDDGNLAIEGTDLSNRQAKVFFATQGVVRESNARLLEVDSPYKLDIDQPNALTVNAGPINRQLSRVVPSERARQANAGTGFDLGGDRCNEVAEKATQSGSLAGEAPVQISGLPPKLPDPEFRLARYIAGRQQGQSHLQAVGNLAQTVDSSNMQSISDAYTGLLEPQLSTGAEIKTELQTLGVNPRQTLDTALGNYLTSRGAGQNHATAAGGTLGGLNLNPAGLASVDRGYNNLKVPAMAASILLAVQNLGAQNPALPAGLAASLDRYVYRRLVEGLSHVQARVNLGGVDPVAHAAVLTTIDTEYTNQLPAVPAALTAAGLADEVEKLSPFMRFEYQVEPYVRARFAGQNHAQAVATVPGLSAAVLAQLDTAYNNVQGRQALTPGQRAAALTAQLTALGVNQFAGPEVGQIFGSGFTGSPGDDKRTLNYRTGERLNASEEAWSSHYGSVVAKSGDDRITLENYARVAENQGDIGGRTKEYYFQMYGRNAGQSWHEVWSTAGRPVMNAVTLTYGKSKQQLWSEQLAKLPSAVPGVKVPQLPTLLALSQVQIKAAPDVATARTLYYAALDQLAVTSLHAHRNRAQALGAGSGTVLAPPQLTQVTGPGDGTTVAGELAQWVTAIGAARAGKWKINLVGRHQLQKQATRFQVLQAKMTDIVGFHGDRRV